jgi:putative IMPACT (imprinted ancient) family translation regulator
MHNKSEKLHEIEDRASESEPILALMTNMIDTYQSIQHPSEAVYKEKGSKFLALAYPVETEEDIKRILSQLKKEYFDATHHCYAYVLGAKQEKWRANDDGEPNHSAGTPILNQIKAKGISDVL